MVSLCLQQIMNVFSFFCYRNAAVGFSQIFKGTINTQRYILLGISSTEGTDRHIFITKWTRSKVVDTALSLRNFISKMVRKNLQ